MFILDTDQPPATTAELIRAITASLKRSIDLSTANDPVQIGGNLPDLESIAVDVSNSDVIASQSLPDRDQLNDTLPGPTSKSIAILGNPVRIATIPVQLSARCERNSLQLWPRRLRPDHCNTRPGVRWPPDDQARPIGYGQCTAAAG